MVIDSQLNIDIAPPLLSTIFSLNILLLIVVLTMLNKDKVPFSEVPLLYEI